MRIHRLEFGIIRDEDGKPVNECLNMFEGSCYCKFLDIGIFYVTWLGYECMGGIYDDKAREYRIRRYLKKRAKRKTTSRPS